MKQLVFGLVALVGLSGVAEQPQRNGNFMAQQAYSEMQRVTSQVDAIESNLENLSGRVARLENGRNDQGLQAEVEALKASVAKLRSDQQRLRQEIVDDIMKRLKPVLQAQRPADSAPAPVSAYSGPVEEYTVAAGDTLSLIAEAFSTKVSTLKQMNGLKSDNLRVGQKLRVPKAK